MEFGSQCAGCFAGLSCGTRLKIVKLLQNGKIMSVSEIANKFNLTQPTITHHLLYLKEMGILKSKKEGRNVFYRLDPKCGWNNCEIFR